MSKISKINHAAGIFADISVDGPIIGTLVCVIDRAKNLPNRKTMGKQNPYAAARLGKEAKKTQTDLRGGQTPRWDSELRFTVHESPDYFKLKVSVFNDDKKTDMIGETWVDLQNLIIPGGSQNDHWHPLQCRGKYAGDIRIEMTYYDTRQQDEAIIGRRQEAADRVQGKISSTPSSANTGLSGPRQLKDVKRRPLPSGPPGAPVRPAPLEHAQSAPVLHHPVPSRPAIPDHSHTLPGPPDVVSHASRHPEPVYEAPSHPEPSPLRPRSRSGYDGPSEHHPPEWDNSAMAPLRRQNTHELPYASNEATETPYDPRLQQQQQLRSYASNEATDAPYDQHLQQQQQLRSSSNHDQPPSRDYRVARQDQHENVHDLANHHSLQQETYAQAQIQQPRYNPDPMSYGAAHVYELPGSDFMSSSPALVDDLRYHQPSIRPLQITARPHDYHPEYAGMQPRVEDEDEDGPPPPPPVHRSHGAHPQLPTPRSSHDPYAPTYTTQSASRSPVPQPPSTMYTPSSHDRYQEPFAKGSSPAMPASLVAGYESGDSAERAALESSVRGRSTHWDDEMMLTQAPVPVAVPASAPVHHDTPVYPLRTSPRPIDQRPTSSRGGSVSPDSRAVTRKSVSPRPTSSDGRGGSSIPFSPDSYNSLNPNTSHTPSRDPSPAYDSPLQARDAAVRAKVEAMRDAEQPIIGDDGREIDPSDHLPTDTWAPEPERKNRKPEVIIRFKHQPRPTSRGNDAPSTRSPGPPRVGFRSETTTYPSDRPVKYTPTHVQASPGSMVRTPPRPEYSRERSDSYAQSRAYNTPTSVDRPRSSRSSVSPSPGSRSPLYDYNAGPPIPNKVPVIGGSSGYPVMSGNPNGGNVRMDALSRELSTIDIGSPTCSPGRGAVRKYVPRAPASMGYAS
ncbi:uncharacterized protein N7515_008339 [Penicillium bovifimosum]|uniref:C2 domain-containing protein n=1 Tax=Penicillium bovifimosum TaxID=126998 RepID=A0A9W9GN88_9EURO|nr:uncharacterized protein N7515_008339 [Penicillium bovifimosum]KAJ5124514.1 hypothetical protein N7515_008339 [Penicillium bovifimosum]